MGWFWKEGEAPDTVEWRRRARRRPWWQFVLTVAALCGVAIWSAFTPGNSLYTLVSVASVGYLFWARFSPLEESSSPPPENPAWPGSEDDVES